MVTYFLFSLLFHLLFIFSFLFACPTLFTSPLSPFPFFFTFCASLFHLFYFCSCCQILVLLYSPSLSLFSSSSSILPSHLFSSLFSLLISFFLFLLHSPFTSLLFFILPPYLFFPFPPSFSLHISSFLIILILKFSFFYLSISFSGYFPLPLLLASLHFSLPSSILFFPSLHLYPISFLFPSLYSLFYPTFSLLSSPPYFFC